MRRQSDKALKKLVAELATAAEQDIVEVLAELEEGDRHKVAALLHRHAPRLRPEEPAPAPRPVPNPHEGLSPWLAQRLAETAADESKGDRRKGRPFAMTPGASEALRAAAAAMSVRPNDRPAERGRSLFGHLHAALRDKAALL